MLGKWIGQKVDEYIWASHNDQNTPYNIPSYFLFLSLPYSLPGSSSIISNPFSFSFILYRCVDRKKSAQPTIHVNLPAMHHAKKELANIHLHINLLLRLFNIWWSKLINLVTSIDIVYFPSNRVYAWLQLKSAGSYAGVLYLSHMWWFWFFLPLIVYAILSVIV